MGITTRQMQGGLQPGACVVKIPMVHKWVKPNVFRISGFQYEARAVEWERTQSRGINKPELGHARNKGKAGQQGMVVGKRREKPGRTAVYLDTTT